MARTRRVFGPLFWGTLIVGAGVLLYVGMLRARLWHDRRPETARPDPEASVAALVPAVKTGDSAHRLEAIVRLREVLQGTGSNAPLRDQALLALREALHDPDDALVRTAAAEALEALDRVARPAAGDLVEMLKDDDIEARIAAARALLKISGEFQAPAITALAGVVASSDPAVPNRQDLVAIMSTIGGEVGQKAAAESLAVWLTRSKPTNGRVAERCVIALGAGAKYLRPAFEKLMKSDVASQRFDAALALAQTYGSFPRHYAMAHTVMWASSGDDRPGPQCVAILEEAAMDTARLLKERQYSLAALCLIGEQDLDSRGGMRLVFPSGSPVPPALRRCGLKLALQLADEDAEVRLAAAKLLHMIHPEQLAGQAAPARAGK